MICTKCKKDLPITSFSIRSDTGKPRRQCKVCRKLHRHSHYIEHKPIVAEYCKQYYLDNRERIAKRQAKYYSNNKESFAYRGVKWAKLNPEKSKTHSRESSARFRKSKYGKFREIIRSSARRHDEKFKITDLNYTLEQFITRIEYLFKDGMTWDNYGEWELDHIKPVKRFYEQGKFDINLVNALCNLQPLWKTDNRKKSAIFIILK